MSIIAAGPDVTSAGLEAQALSCAVALVTRQQECRDVSRGALLDGHAPGAVIVALETIAGCLLDALPARGGQVLEALGLLALEESARCGGDDAKEVS